MILSNDAEIGKKINSAVFPGLQGGPLMHVIAAKAVAFGEALRPEFQHYARTIVDNAKTLAAGLMAGGLAIVTGGTEIRRASGRERVCQKGMLSVGPGLLKKKYKKRN